MHENKKEFIRDLETALILYSRVDIKGLEYFQTEYDEYLIIKFTTGWEKKVNITGDSCIAVMHDLYRALQ